MKVGETPGNGEESPTFREEPKKWNTKNIIIIASLIGHVLSLLLSQDGQIFAIFGQ